MKFLASLLLIAVASPVFSAETASPADLLPPQSKIVVGIHVRTVLDSGLFHSLLSQAKVSPGDLAKLVPVLGFDPLNDVDEILIASSGEGPNPPALIVARGRFNSDKIAAVSAAGGPYHGVPLLSQGGDSAFAFLNDSTVLAGDPDEVKAAIDRRAFPAQNTAHIDATLASQIADYSGRYSIWGIVNKLDALSQRLPASSSQSKTVDSIDHMQFGVSVSQGLEIAAEFHARSAKDAQELSTTARFLESMLKASQPSLDNGAKLGIETRNDGTVKFSVALSEEQVKKSVGSLFGAQPASVTAQPSNLAHAPTPAKPRNGNSSAAARAKNQRADAPLTVVTPVSDDNSASAPATLSHNQPAETTPSGDRDTGIFTLPGRR